MFPFADERTDDVFKGRHRKDVPDSVARRAIRQIDMLLAATKLEDCRIAGRGPGPGGPGRVCDRRP